MQKWLEDSSGVERLKQLNSNFLSDVLSNMQQISEKKNTPNMTNDSIKTNNSTLQARSNNSAIQQLPKVQSVSSVAAPKATREVVLNVPKITPPRILPRPGPTVIRSESDLNDFLLFNSLNTESSRVEKMSTVRANRYCHSLKLAEEKAQALRMSNSTSHKLQIQAKSLHIISSCNVKSTKRKLKCSKTAFKKAKQNLRFYFNEAYVVTIRNLKFYDTSGFICGIFQHVVRLNSRMKSSTVIHFTDSTL